MLSPIGPIPPSPRGGLKRGGDLNICVSNCKLLQEEGVRTWAGLTIQIHLANIHKQMLPFLFSKETADVAISSCFGCYLILLIGTIIQRCCVASVISILDFAAHITLIVLMISIFKDSNTHKLCDENTSACLNIELRMMALCVGSFMAGMMMHKPHGRTSCVEESSAGFTSAQKHCAKLVHRSVSKNAVDGKRMADHVFDVANTPHMATTADLMSTE